MAKRQTRQYTMTGDDFVSGTKYRTRKFYPNDAKQLFGFDGEIKLGKRELEKLGSPDRIKVTIVNY